ncbi:Piso0_000517 [Millerozyma farinosa CBS 7064]|uniref:Cytochrome c oxidase assembly protein COX16, mitochondrial n=1 Tax=Pichia sorbitophila (strain ATCC MYA-4447 / BCRC 22081 / CBS 7064 / NBRC 10061 / NRRL Y-12695) TaxID=559304 RepID=G8YVN1_PICSO|nr:Piso0_000517 [Millerozyma farinosa CBS 7064]CCE73475.1 Piso0_000517 [Millerozyma farinosa CBS 7064]
MVYMANRPFRGKKEQEAYERSIPGQYQKLLRKNHFLFFGLPFLLSIVAGSLYLQKFTSVKWERYDEKHRQLEEDEMLSMIENRRPVNKRDDYYRLQGLLKDHQQEVANDDYEIVRVKRKKEDEPVW